MRPLVLSRRTLLKSLPIFALPAAYLAGAEAISDEALARIEKGIGGRLGMAAVNTGTGRRLAYRSAERFAMCSTFKFLLAACVLHKTEEKVEDLDRPISYGKKDLMEYAPVTREHVQEGSMTIGGLCAAAVEVSDNTAANLLLNVVGGPAGLTEFMRFLGNDVTRLDRTEPDLNDAVPGDPRDTTSPAAMLDSMEKLLTGKVLKEGNRDRLTGWLEHCTTGKNRLRAGIPADWRAGDKTGTGDHGAMGDLGIFWPPGKPPILAVAYLAEEKASTEQREQAIAAVGRLIAERL